MSTKRKSESKSSYVSRCISVRQREYPKKSVKQSTAVYYSLYKGKK